MINTKKQNNLMFIIVILMGGFLSLLTETLLNNAIPAIMREVHVSQTSAQWLNTGYILVVGIMMPLSAYFLNRFRLKPLFITTMVIFLLGTLISVMSFTFTFLLLGRLVQAISVGISMPLTQSLMMLIFPIDKRGSAMGLSSIVIILGPAIGPTLSGWIVDQYSWQMLFIILIPISIIIIILSMIFVRNITQPTGDKLDWKSLALSSLGFGILLYGFSSIGNTGSVDLSSLVMVVVGIIFVILFVIRQLKMEKPMLEMKVFKSISFTKTTILAALSSIALLGVELILPLYVQNVRGVSALDSGLIMLPGAIIMGIISPIAGRLFDKHGIKWLAIIGFGILTLASVPMIWFDHTTSVVLISTLYAIRMLGLGLVMMQLNTSGVNALPAKYLVHGNTVASTFRQVASSLGSALLVTVSTMTAKLSANGHSVTLANTATGYQWTFMVVTGFSLLCFLMAFTLRNKTAAEITG